MKLLHGSLIKDTTFVFLVELLKLADIYIILNLMYFFVKQKQLNGICSA